MAETFMTVVNEVLDSVGEPRLSSANFTSATNKQAKVKTIVARTYQSLQTGLPDEQLNVSEEIKLYQRHEFPGGEDMGITTITGADPAVVTFTGLASLTTPPDGYPPLASPQNCMIEIRTHSDHGTFDHTQWYRIKSITGLDMTLDKQHLVTDEIPAGLGPLSSPDIIGATIVQYRVPLPADFQDIRDADKPFGSGVDLQSVSRTELNRRIAASGGAYIADNPRYYAFGYDIDLVAGTRIGPFLFFYPFPSNARYYRLEYKRKLVAVTEASAYNTVFDLPAEMIPTLIYQATTRAKVDIANRVEEAGVYAQLAAQENKQLRERQVSQTDAKTTMAPDMSAYRGFYRNVRRGPSIWVDE